MEKYAADLKQYQGKLPAGAWAYNLFLGWSVWLAI